MYLVGASADLCKRRSGHAAHAASSIAMENGAINKMSFKESSLARRNIAFVFCLDPPLYRITVTIPNH